MDFMRALRHLGHRAARGPGPREGTVAQVQADPKVQEVYLGTAAADEPTTGTRRLTMLELSDVRRRLRAHRGLHGVDLEVPADGVAAVMGHNGAGKTPCCAPRSGCCRPTSGKVRFDGEDITKLRPSASGWRAAWPTSRRASSRFGQLTTAENLQVVADGRKRGKAADRRGTRPVPRADGPARPARRACSPAASASSSPSPAR